MPRKALTCTVELDVYELYCCHRKHLSIELRNPYFNRTKIKLQTFTNAREPTHVIGILEDEHVLFELVQYSDVYRGGKVLARHEQSAREFLYPTPTLTGKDGTERELLLGRTVHFSGIDPKLEFSSNSTIQETTVPGTYAELTRIQATEDPESDSESDTSSETEEELILNPTPTHHNHSLHSKEYHCICECPRRPENNGQVVMRSRAMSPSRRPQSATPSYRPPFKVGKADEKIISRREFLSSGRSRSQNKVFPAEGDPAPCPNCRIPHKDCVVCQAYRKVYGKEFLKHRFGHIPHKRTTSTPVYTSFASEPPRARARLPDDEPIYQSRAFSEPLPYTRRIYPHEPSRYGSYLSSPSQEIHNRVGGAVRRNSPLPRYTSSLQDLSDTDDDDNDSLLSLQELRSEINEARLESLDRSFEDPEHPTLGTRLDRSVTVHLSDDKFWSNRKAEYTGQSHRTMFENSLQDIYRDMYNKAKEPFC